MKKIIVTGGSGNVAEWVISDLLNHGYQVHASLRNLAKVVKVQSAVERQVSAEKCRSYRFFRPI